MKIVRVMLVIVVLLAGAGLAWRYWLQPAQALVAAAAITPEPSATVTEGAIEALVSASGTVAANRVSTLTLGTSGKVETVSIEQGQAVQAGDLLAVLDDTNLREQVERAKASLVSAQARLAQAQAPATQGQIDAAEASIASAQASLKRLLSGPTELEQQSAKLGIDSAKNQLWSAQAQRDATKGNRMSSDAAKDSAEAQVLVAEVAVQQAEVALAKLQESADAQEIAASRAQVEQAQAQLAQLHERPRAEDVAVAEAAVREAELSLRQAEQGLEDARLRAPYASTVLAVHLAEGEWAAMGAPAVQVADTETLMMQVLIDEVDIAQVQEGQSVRLRFDALPKQEALGAVTRIAPSATQTTSGQAFEVEIQFERGELPVRIGMTASVDIVIERRESALLVPNRAVQAEREAERYYVTVITALGKDRREVQIGLRDDAYTQIIEGVALGDTVLLQTLDVGTANAASGPFPPMTGQRP